MPEKINILRSAISATGIDWSRDSSKDAKGFFMTQQPQAKYRHDYRAPDYQITDIDLTFDLDAEKTVVTAVSQAVRHGASDAPLKLKLPEKTAETLIVLIADRDRVHIRETRAAETGHHALEPLFIHVKSVEAAAGTHESADRKRLAAGTGAEIAHHLTALRRDEPRDQLAAFVLNINHAVLIERPVRDA